MEARKKKKIKVKFLHGFEEHIIYNYSEVHLKFQYDNIHSWLHYFITHTYMQSHTHNNILSVHLIESKTYNSELTQHKQTSVMT